MTIRSAGLYARQSATPAIGREGLAKLKSATVAIAGVGGVGSSAAYYLARSGVGRVILIDQDIIEPSNLDRIHSATKGDIFHPKAEVIARKLQEFDTSIRAQAIVDTITTHNAEQIFEDVDLIFDGLDNFRTRYVLNRYSAIHGTPYLFASAVASQAHLALLNPPNTPCLECIMPHVTDRFEDSCESLGVTPRATGLAGVIGAQAAIQFLLGSETRLTDDMMTFDLERPEFLFSRLLRRPSCATCGKTKVNPTAAEPEVSLLCGEHTANVIPMQTLKVELGIAALSIPFGRILLQSDSALVYQYGAWTVSIFRNGRILIAGITQEREALNVAHEIWRDLEKSKAIKPIETPTDI